MLPEPGGTDDGRGAALPPVEVEALDLGGQRGAVPRRQAAGAGLAHQSRGLVVLLEQRQDRAAGVQVLVHLGRHRGVAARRLPQDQRVRRALQGARPGVGDRPGEVHDALQPQRHRAVLVAGLVGTGQPRADAAARLGAARQHLVQRLEQHLHVGRQRQHAGEHEQEAVRVALRRRLRPGPGLLGLVAVGQEGDPPGAGGRALEPGGMRARGHEHEVGAGEDPPLHLPLPGRVPRRGRAAAVQADPRVAEVGDPGQAEAAGQRQRREMHAVGGRAREHGVHAAARDPRGRGAARPRRPAGVRVGQQPPVGQRAQPAEDRAGAAAPAPTAQPQPRRQRAAPRHAQHLGRRRDPLLERLVPHPVVLRARTHHRAVPAVLRQPAREAQRALHPATAQRRVEVP